MPGRSRERRPATSAGTRTQPSARAHDSAGIAQVAPRVFVLHVREDRERAQHVDAGGLQRKARSGLAKQLDTSAGRRVTAGDRGARPGRASNRRCRCRCSVRRRVRPRHARPAGPCRSRSPRACGRAADPPSAAIPSSIRPIRSKSPPPIDAEGGSDGRALRRAVRRCCRRAACPRPRARAAARSAPATAAGRCRSPGRIAASGRIACGRPPSARPVATSSPR